MPVHMLTAILLCLSPTWRILTPVSSHPRHSQCQLIQRTALCNHCNLSSVPAGLPDNLEELQLNYNNIQTLQSSSLLGYPSLNTLSLACNRLENLESNTFQHSKLLKNLNLANNNLYAGCQESSHALKTLPGLRALDLSENGLEDDMVATLLQNLTSLEYLNLSGNLLQRLDETSFVDLHQLKELDLQKNIMYEIDGAFDGNPMLQRLNLAFNYLPCLTDFHMTQLVVLNASHNFIEWFIAGQDLNDTFQLETLDLSNNKMLFFPFLPNHSHLRNLYLSQNSISFYEHLADNGTFPNLTSTVEFYNMKTYTGNVTAQLWEESLHGDISSLEILDLRGNQVDHFPKGFIQKMPALSRLHMFTNCLETLNLTSHRFSGSLYELDLSNNRLNQIVADRGTLNALGNLTYLNLSLNSLEGLPSGLFSSLAGLRSVDLSYNNVDICHPEEADPCTDNSSTWADWKNAASLTQLYLKGCNLKIIPLSAFAGLSLTHLELSDNPGLVVHQSIQSLSRTIRHLGLGNTQIQDFEFSHLQSLEYLSISRNYLTHLPPSLLNLDLKVLDLRDNRLPTIPPAQANALASKLHTVFLTGNPFNCCQTEWFRTFETTKTINMVGRSDIKCKDLNQLTYRVEKSHSFFCLEKGGESFIWYILLFVPMCLSLVGILIIVWLTFKPKMLKKSIKKNCLMPTSY
nr:transforming growth factor beta activator LRRC33 [Gasterosteus aculeatus aculeatus]XP_040023160.1 transforming growth factor beta activator LRRC33 [Gasterosteus aculeatus aculeatus]XP_040023161.1 transforming growth factor beta activator LRRC33 [Gasterosteus aculeatus aculeatus]XP_040023162.1 transforming growth factor beta activator LRRC33 [Gasterosteus aculeatus aculeatus]XP_040023163.1 transforming growth factor beta activator LRRC33 [Gasterosteus aculeatus aculeatus]XP_040023164.1 trans